MEKEELMAKFTEFIKSLEEPAKAEEETKEVEETEPKQEEEKPVEEEAKVEEEAPANEQEEVFIDVNTLVTKDSLEELLKSTLEPLLARLDATDKQVGDITEKFVGNDVGTPSTPKGEGADVKEGESFDSYSAKFMNN